MAIKRLPGSDHKRYGVSHIFTLAQQFPDDLSMSVTFLLNALLFICPELVVEQREIPNTAYIDMMLLVSPAWT